MAYTIQGSKHPVVFCANPRTGSTATANTLLSMGATKQGEHHDPPETLEPETLVVETVRHHCDVFVSWWFWRNSSMAFPKFVRTIMNNEHGLLRAKRLYGRFDSNYILRYETLDFEWQVLCENAGLEQTKIERSSNTKRPKNIKWQTLFPFSLKKEVYDMYGEEMEELGYGTT